MSATKQSWNERASAGKEKKPKPLPLNHWTRGLVRSMENPDNIVIQDEQITVIKDAYPKAKFHYLVLPKENIANIFKLDKTHLPLLRHMEELARKVIADNNEAIFKIGYHSVPSLQRLHLHVISDDMVSPSLKNKTHWNSFTTKFFFPSEDLCKMIEENNYVKKISEDLHKQYMATPLKCHKCDFIPKNMPILKTHLLSHL